MRFFHKRRFRNFSETLELLEYRFDLTEIIHIHGILWQGILLDYK